MGDALNFCNKLVIKYCFFFNFKDIYHYDNNKKVMCSRPELWTPLINNDLFNAFFFSNVQRR